MLNDKKGIALINLALMLLLVGLALVFGLRMMGSEVAKDKRLETKKIIDVASNAVIGFASKNDRLPDIYEFKTLVRNSKDVWGNDLQYYPDNSLDNDDGTSTICGKTSTDTIVQDCADDSTCDSPTDEDDVAFVILSGGENRNIQTLVASATIKTYQQGLLGIDDYTSGLDRNEEYKDIMKIVNLAELKVKAGCFGETGLRIVNTSLPTGTITKTYTVNIFAENGVPFADGGDSGTEPDYQWCVKEPLQTGLLYTCNGSLLTSTTCSLSDGNWNSCTNLQISGIPTVTGTIYLPIYVRDDESNINSKVLPLTINPDLYIYVCPTGKYRVWNELGITKSFIITGHSCITGIADSGTVGELFNGSEITFNYPTVALEAGELIYAYNQPTQCVSLIQTATFNDAVLADANRDCCISMRPLGPPDFTDFIDRVCASGSDNDGDGYLTPADCNDLNASINPGATEVCDLIDNNCNGSTDEGFDADNDGYKTCTGDCNDINALINPGVYEACDSIDNDCDGSIDEGHDADNDGYKTCTGDCNDSNASIHPGANDTNCNLVDEDCDGTADDGYVMTGTSCGLGACAGNTGQLQCVSGVVINTCNPFLGAAPDDTVCNGIDDDCSGATDEDYVITATACGVGACAATGQNQCVSGSVINTCTPGAPAPDDATCNNIDEDCDGVADEDYPVTPTSCGVGVCAATGQNQCVSGSVDNTCTAGSPTETPEATCSDSLDNDCDGNTDETDTDCGAHVYYCDSDGDTFISSSVSGSCSGDGCEPAGCVLAAGDDCNDSNASRHPGAAETCNNADDNCDGTVDNFTRATSCGLGVCSVNTGVETCTAGSWGGNTCNPLAGASAEVCDGLDNNCNGTPDEGLSRGTTCGVGVCAGNTGTETCELGIWANNTCNPYGGQSPENSIGVCIDGLDNDCDGSTDMADLTCSGTDICEISGMTVRNETSSNKKTKIGGGSCSNWNKNSNTPVGYSEVLGVYPVSGSCVLADKICDKTYFNFRQVDYLGNNNCTVQLTDPCSIADDIP